MWLTALLLHDFACRVVPIRRFAICRLAALGYQNQLLQTEVDSGRFGVTAPFLSMPERSTDMPVSPTG
jgi:hypothetical protein